MEELREARAGRVLEIFRWFEAMAANKGRRQQEEQVVQELLRGCREKLLKDGQETVEAAGRAVAEARVDGEPLPLGPLGSRTERSFGRPGWAMVRRIDGLYCSRDSVEETARRVVAEAQAEAERVRQEAWH